MTRARINLATTGPLRIWVSAEAAAVTDVAEPGVKLTPSGLYSAISAGVVVAAPIATVTAHCCVDSTLYTGVALLSVVSTIERSKNLRGVTDGSTCEGFLVTLIVNDGVVPVSVLTYRMLAPVTGIIGEDSEPAAVNRLNW